MIDFDELTGYENIVQKFFAILKPCQVIDGADLESWELITSQKGTAYVPVQSHIYWWMSWAINGYKNTGILANPRDAWNVWDLQGEVKSEAGKGFFSGINRDLFTGILEVSNVPSHGYQIENMSIKFTAEGFANESISKDIIFSCIGENGQQLITKSTNVTASDRIGLNHRSEIFGKKKRDTHAVRIEVWSGNLFTRKNRRICIFDQTYSLDELRMLDGHKVILTNTEPVLNLRSQNMYKSLEFEKQSPIVDTIHLIFDPSSDDSPLSESDDGDEPPFDDDYVSEDIDDEEDDIFYEENVYSGPPAKNSFYTPEKDTKWRSEAYPSLHCRGCFFGHDHKCGFR